ncbi:hypothetical protein PPERSA_06845 [Pseudocohnilembus persalinus]|uniref:Uncharacterized protein n=1 Tax=Pseudocohnilembus persalinus TaxID=266149 RepID=A0A0V0QSN4_PSEPJ|nr:hypothetical protein PPERSA_06845 [Pseudocohnilembus persalinus]|eukprot:KRX05211.1 hypothetical protein PPERSA_06845 [Pseudocohnilembus persalinus]
MSAKNIQQQQYNNNTQTFKFKSPTNQKMFCSTSQFFKSPNNKNNINNISVEKDFFDQVDKKVHENIGMNLNEGLQMLKDKIKRALNQYKVQANLNKIKQNNNSKK